MVSLATVVRGTLGRFLPTCVFIFAVGLVPVMASDVKGMSPWAPLIMLLWSAGATIGFGAVLAAIRHKLSDDAPVNARPSIVAGVVAPVAILLALMGPPIPRVVGALYCALAGGILALAMFFPWLSGRRAAVSATTTAGSLPGESVVVGFEPRSRTYTHVSGRTDDESGTA